MLIYLAGAEPAWRDQLEGHHLLVSYAEPKQLPIVGAGWDGPKPLVDSGAFAIWKGNAGRREGLDVAGYCAYLNANRGAYEAAIAFDVIGGTVDENLANLNRMEREGLERVTVPVFHEGDPWRLLEAYLGRGYEYIALAGTVSRGTPTLLRWLLEVLDRYPPGPGRRYHGLAMTQARIITELASVLYSVDSSSWLNPVRYGVKGSYQMFSGRTPAFMRSIGIGALLDMPQSKLAPERGGAQLALFQEN